MPPSAPPNLVPRCPTPTVQLRTEDEVLILTINRPEKRNALNVPTVEGIGTVFAELPESIRAVVMHGAGDHFSAGLDLNELQTLTAAQGMHHSRRWHRIFNDMEHGRVPIIAALHGAVIGGGLELACVAHIRVAEPSAFYALPEGQRGIFVGGGAAVRVPRLIGVARMMDMMMTGRVYGAEEGERVGLSQYLVGAGESLPKAIELAHTVARNAPMTNFALINALPLIAEASPEMGYLGEAMVSAIAQAEPEAKARLESFLAKREPKVGGQR